MVLQKDKDETGHKKGGLHRKLLMGEVVKISDWLRNNHERILSERPLFTELSAMVKEGTGIYVSEKSVRQLCDALSIVWEVRIKRGGVGVEGGVKYRLGKLEERVVETELAVGTLNKTQKEVLLQIDQVLKDLTKQIVEIRGALNHLYSQLNASPPPGYIVPKTAFDHTSTSVGGKR